MKIPAFFAALAVTTAYADPQRSDPSPDVTVFTDQATVVTLVKPPPADGSVRPLIFDVMNWEKNGQATNIRRHGNPDLPSYWARWRIIDGILTCEKFAPRPSDPDAIEKMASALFAAPCN